MLRAEPAAAPSSLRSGGDRSFKAGLVLLIQPVLLRLLHTSLTAVCEKLFINEVYFLTYLTNVTTYPLSANVSPPSPCCSLSFYSNLDFAAVKSSQCPFSSVHSIVFRENMSSLRV